jgi:hypothetical protein
LGDGASHGPKATRSSQRSERSSLGGMLVAVCPRIAAWMMCRRIYIHTVKPAELFLLRAPQEFRPVFCTNNP